MSEYQNRRDIDKIFDDFYDYQNNTIAVVFSEESPYRAISSTVKPKEPNNGTIDAILEYYGLTTIADDMLELIYPVGSLYQTTNEGFDPNSNFKGLWEMISDDDGIYVWERVNEAE